MPDDRSLGSNVAAWFEARGFRLRVVEMEPDDQHVWVDLLALDGRVIQRDYGRGQSATDAMLRARDRFLQEQGE